MRSLRMTVHAEGAFYHSALGDSTVDAYALLKFGAGEQKIQVRIRCGCAIPAVKKLRYFFQSLG